MYNVVPNYLSSESWRAVPNIDSKIQSTLLDLRALTVKSVHEAGIMVTPQVSDLKVIGMKRRTHVMGAAGTFKRIVVVLAENVESLAFQKVQKLRTRSGHFDERFDRFHGTISSGKAA